MGVTNDRARAAVRAEDAGVADEEQGVLLCFIDTLPEDPSSPLAKAALREEDSNKLIVGYLRTLKREETRPTPDAERWTSGVAAGPSRRAASVAGADVSGLATDQAVYAQLRPPAFVSNATVPSEAEFGDALLNPQYRLPVLPYLIKKYPDLAVHMVATAGCDLSVELSHIITQEVLPGRSEQDAVLLVGRFTKYLQSLALLPKSATTVSIAMDVAEPVGSGTHRISQSAAGGSPHPDLIVTIHGLSILFGEFQPLDLQSAWKDNEAKLHGGFPPLFYGPVPFIPLLAATTTSIQFGYLRPDGMVVQLNRELHLGMPKERLTALFAFTSLHHILQHLASLAPPRDERVPLNRPQFRLNDVTVMVNGDTAVKRIPTTTFTDIGTSFAVVKAAHERANSCHDLVGAKPLEEQATKKRRSDGVPFNNICVVTMTSLGYPKLKLTKAEKKAAVRCCLQASHHLHSADPPLVHCDIRLPNLLWGPKPFLSDLEMAHTAPWQVDASMSRPSQWTNSTLDENDCYTCASDLHQIGIMMEVEMAPLEDEAKELAELLRGKDYTVEKALLHEYLTASAP